MRQAKMLEASSTFVRSRCGDKMARIACLECQFSFAIYTYTLGLI
jgi:hypothetical protein